eukprot:scaffold27.g6001.t1
MRPTDPDGEFYDDEYGYGDDGTSEQTDYDYGYDAGFYDGMAASRGERLQLGRVEDMLTEVQSALGQIQSTVAQLTNRQSTGGSGADGGGNDQQRRVPKPISATRISKQLSETTDIRGHYLGEDELEGAVAKTVPHCDCVPDARQSIGDEAFDLGVNKARDMLRKKVQHPLNGKIKDAVGVEYPDAFPGGRRDATKAAALAEGDRFLKGSAPSAAYYSCPAFRGVLVRALGLKGVRGTKKFKSKHLKDLKLSPAVVAYVEVVTEYTLLGKELTVQNGKTLQAEVKRRTAKVEQRKSDYIAWR